MDSLTMKTQVNIYTVYKYFWLHNVLRTAVYFIGESNSEEENESADQEESEDDDDVRWYKEEVGEEPDKGRNGYF